MAFSDIALIFIQMIVYFWSFITWPFYFIYYGPWKRTRNFKRKRATQIDIKTDEVTYRAKPRLSHLRTILKNHEANIRTMDKGNNNNNFIFPNSMEKCGSYLGYFSISFEKITL